MIYVETYKCTVYTDDGCRAGVIHQDHETKGFYYVPRGTPSRTNHATFSKYKTVADLKCVLERP